VCDEVVAKGDHDVALYFHVAEHAVVRVESANRFRIDVPGGDVVLVLDMNLSVQAVRGSDDPIAGWVSRSYHQKLPSVTLIARGRSRGPSSFVTRVLIG
jgi:hypothetical protein